MNKNQKTLLAVALIFILPVTLAYLALNLGLYTPGVGNKGELLEPPLEITTAEQEQLPDTWRIGTRIPADCTQGCEHAIYVLSQTWYALGRENDRVNAVGITGREEPTPAPRVPDDSVLEFYQLPETHELLEELPPYSLFIMDPLGNIILYYEGSSDRDTMIMQARDLLDDLETLLKMSRVG